MEFNTYHEHVDCWKNSYDELQQNEMHFNEFMPLMSKAQVVEPDARDAFVTENANRPATTSAMASELERPGQDGYELGSASPEVPSPTADIDYRNGKFDSSQGEGGSKSQDEASSIKGTKDDRVRPQAHPEIRKPTRFIRPVPGMPHQVEMEHQPSRMGALRRSIGFITIATAFLHQCLGRIMADESPRSPGLQTGVPDYESYTGGATFNTFGQGTDYEATEAFNFYSGIKGKSSPAEPSAGTTSSDRGNRCMEPPGRTTSTANSKLGSTLRPPGAGLRAGDPQRIRLGRMRRLINKEKSAEVLSTESQIYDDLPPSSAVPKIDIVELYAGQAEISHLAHRYGLRACQPFDILYGMDMKQPSTQKTWRDAQESFNPLLVVVEIECTHWNTFNENLNYAGKDRMDELEALRDDDRPLVRQGVLACERQIQKGNLFLLENPQASRIWELPEVQRLSMRDDVFLVCGHAGAYGGVNSKGDPIKKTYQWLTNSKKADAVSRKLDLEQLSLCTPLIGKEVRLSAQYPTKLCQAILRATRIEARRRWPQRFLAVNEVYYQEPMQDPAAWMDALRETQRIFNTTSIKTLNLSDTDPLYGTIKDLVPWDLVRIQITPIVRRLPRDITYTHRGAALEYQDGSIDVESEPLDGLHFPKQRFKKAVSFGIFWFGNGEVPTQKDELPQEQPEDQDQRQLSKTSVISTVTFPGCPAEVTNDKAAIRRLRLNLGHPSEKELLRLLAWQGAISKQMITAVKCLQCASCGRAQKHKQPRPSAMPTANIGQFNDNLQSDVFYCRDVLGNNHAIVGIVDQSTLLHQAARLPDLTSATMAEMFKRIWFKPYGYPQCIRVDPGGTYAKDFRDYVERHGIFLEVIPAEAHWRIGLIERRNSVLRDIMERIIDAEAVMSDIDIEETIDSATHALNSMTYTHGRPPYMAVFGQIPRVGMGILQDDQSLVTKPDQPGHLRPDILRAEAMKALVEINASQSLRRALLRKTATPHHNELLPGQNCAYWRWQNPRGRSTKKRGAWVVARFLAYDPDGKSAWLHSGTTTLQASLEQIRGAHGFENWQPSKEDIQCLRDATTNIRRDLWEDRQAPAPPPDEDEYDYQMHQLEDSQLQPDTLSPIQPLAPPLTVQPQQTNTSVNIQQPSTTNISVQQSKTTHRQQHMHQMTDIHAGVVNIYSPTHAAASQPQAAPTDATIRGRAVTDIDYHTDRFGLTRQARSRTPTNRVPRTPRITDTARPTTPQPSMTLQDTEPPVPTWDATATQPIDMPQEPPEEIPYPQTTTPPTSLYSSDPSGTAEQTIAQPQEALPTLPAKRPHELMLAQIHNNIQPPHYTWDGSAATPQKTAHSVLFSKTATNMLQAEGYAVLETDLTGQQSESDAESSASDTQPDVSIKKKILTRKEAKALEREIPWRSILKLPKDQIDQYIQSAVKEWKGWGTWDSIEPVTPEEAAKILSNPSSRKRVLRSRACYRNKSKDPNKLVAKTRVVALGHLDPDLASISRDSPTPSRTSECILMAIFAAGCNGSVENQPMGWILWAGDVSTAFLQGRQDMSERPDELFLQPPQDEIARRAKTFPAPLYRIKGNVYGLASAPRTWYKEVCRRLLEIGYQQHSLDRLLFYKRSPDNDHLMAVAIVYVDDMLLTHREDYDKSEILEKFTWGSSKQLSLEQSLEFKGKEISLTRTDSKYQVKVTQRQFISNTEPGKVKKGQIQEGAPLSITEQTEFRSVTGSLQWLAGQTRPELAAWVSLSNKGKETGPAELAQLYATLDYARGNPDDGLTFQDVAINKATTVVGYADSSWANAAQCASQQGCLVLLTTPHCTQVATKANLIDWKSNRSSRVCRSTLAAEAIACDDCVDRAHFVSLVLAELLTGTPAHKDPERWKLQQLQVTDCRSLYDAVIAENPRTTEKRTFVDIRSIQEFISVRSIFWTPTSIMFADALTKCTKLLREQMAEWLKRPYVQLKEQTKAPGSTKENNTCDKIQRLKTWSVHETRVLQMYHSCMTLFSFAASTGAPRAEA